MVLIILVVSVMAMVTVVAVVIVVVVVGLLLHIPKVFLKVSHKVYFIVDCCVIYRR